MVDEHRKDLGVYMSCGTRRLRKLAYKGKFDKPEYRKLLLQEVTDLRSFQNWVYDTMERMESDIEALKRDRSILMARVACQSSPSVSMDSSSEHSSGSDVEPCTAQESKDPSVGKDSKPNVTGNTDDRTTK